MYGGFEECKLRNSILPVVFKCDNRFETFKLWQLPEFSLLVRFNSTFSLLLDGFDITDELYRWIKRIYSFITDDETYPQNISAILFSVGQQNNAES